MMKFKQLFFLECEVDFFFTASHDLPYGESFSSHGYYYAHLYEIETSLY